MSRLSIVLLSLPMLLAVPSSGQTVGCTFLQQPVWYQPDLPFAGVSSWLIDAVGARNTAATKIVLWGGERHFTSSDGGQTWHVTREPIASPLALAGSLQFRAPSDPMVLYSYREKERQRADLVLIRSDDGGARWTVPGVRIEGVPAAQLAARISGRKDYHVEVHVAVHPQLPHTLYGTIEIVPWRGSAMELENHFLKGTYKSVDGGENWTPLSDAVGIFHSYDGDTSLGISPVDPHLMFGQGPQGPVKSVDGGQSWAPVGQSDQLNLVPLDQGDRVDGVSVATKMGRLQVKQFALDPVSRDVVYIVSVKGVHRSIDGGNTWQLLNLGFAQLHGVNNMLIDPGDHYRLFVATKRGLFVSENQGCTFRPVELPKM